MVKRIASKITCFTLFKYIQHEVRIKRTRSSSRSLSNYISSTQRTVSRLINVNDCSHSRLHGRPRILRLRIHTYIRCFPFNVCTASIPLISQFSALLASGRAYGFRGRRRKALQTRRNKAYRRNRRDQKMSPFPLVSLEFLSLAHFSISSAKLEMVRRKGIINFLAG